MKNRHNRIKSNKYRVVGKPSFSASYCLSDGKYVFSVSKTGLDTGCIFLYLNFQGAFSYASVFFCIQKQPGYRLYFAVYLEAASLYLPSRVSAVRHAVRTPFSVGCMPIGNGYVVSDSDTPRWRSSGSESGDELITVRQLSSRALRLTGRGVSRTPCLNPF